ncbi:MAG TPA: 4-hydroxy-tetrahydrodipicolinate synthase [Haloplasmataceae bacterium]
MTIFTGSGVALVTPFTSDGIDYERLKDLIEWHIKEGTDAIIVSGTTGEASTLSKKEKEELFDFTVQTVGGRIPVIAGTGGNNTEEVVSLSQYAEKVGVDGLLLVTPYYNRTTQQGLIAHFQTVADRVGIPIILYNVPARTGVNIKPETVYTLSLHPNIVGIKEASGNIGQVAKIASLVGPDFAIYSGNDDSILPVLALGGKGVISVLANICPKATHLMVTYYLNGQIEEAKKLQLTYLPLIEALFIENNPIPVKTAMRLIGRDAGPLRLPLVPMGEENEAKLKQVLKQFNLIAE